MTRVRAERKPARCVPPRGLDVVDEGKDVLGVVVVVLDREVDADLVLRLGTKIGSGGATFCWRSGMLDELRDAALVVEGVLLVLALVDDGDLGARRSGRPVRAGGWRGCRRRTGGR